MGDYCVWYCITILFINHFLVYFKYFKFRKPTFLYYCPDLVVKSCLKTRSFLPCPSHFFPTSSLCRLLLKKQCRANWLSSLVHVLSLRPDWCPSLNRHSCTWKKEQTTFTGWRSDHPCRLSGEHLPIMTPKPVAWVPRYVIFWFSIFIMGWYIVAIPDSGVVYYLCAWHGCDWEQSWWLFMNSGSQKSFDKILSF